jgi:hypothetical protein
MMRRLLNAGLVILAVVLAVGQPARAQETTVGLDPEKTTVSFTLTPCTALSA